MTKPLPEITRCLGLYCLHERHARVKELVPGHYAVRCLCGNAGPERRTARGAVDAWNRQQSLAENFRWSTI